MKKQPFRLLKLIRDREIKHISDLRSCIEGTGSVTPPGYYADRSLRDHVDAFVGLGLVKIGKHGKLSPTRKVEFLKALGVGLSRLSSYTEQSIVANSIFSDPNDPPTHADVFVIMPFSAGLKSIYKEHIKPVVKSFKLSVTRADDFFATNTVVGDIWNAINSAQIIIADCTNKNANVFYELGMAHTLGKKCVLIAQKPEDIPFDVQHLRSFIYDPSSANGLKQLRSSSGDVLKNLVKPSRNNL